MANLTPQAVTVLGTDVTMVTPTAGTGDTVPVGSCFIVRNGSGAGITVTITTPGNDKYGLARPDITDTVGAGVQTHYRIDQPDLADPVTGLVTITCSATASVTVGATYL